VVVAASMPRRGVVGGRRSDSALLPHCDCCAVGTEMLTGAGCPLALLKNRSLLRETGASGKGPLQKGEPCRDLCIQPRFLIPPATSFGAKRPQCPGTGWSTTARQAVPLDLWVTPVAVKAVPVILAVIAAYAELSRSKAFVDATDDRVRTARAARLCVGIWPGYMRRRCRE
jgi:hypothetical protein